MFDKLSDSKEGKILFESIKRAHKYTAYENKVYPWKYLRGYIGRTIAADYNTNDYKELEACKKKIEKTVDYVQEWYQRYYLDDPVGGLPDIEAVQDIEGTSIFGKLPLVLAEGAPALVMVNSVSPKYWKVFLKDDLESRIYLAFATKYFDTPVERIIMYRYFGEGVSRTDFSVSDGNKSVFLILKDVFSAIKLDFSYPIRTESCKLCRYKDVCKI